MPARDPRPQHGCEDGGLRARERRRHRGRDRPQPSSMDAATLRVPGCSVVAQRRSGGLAEGHTTQCSRRLLHFAIVTEQAANLKAVQRYAASLRAFAADLYRPPGRSRRRSVLKPGRSRAGLFGVASVGTAGRGGRGRLRNAELRQTRTATAVHAVTAAGMTPWGVTSR